MLEVSIDYLIENAEWSKDAEEILRLKRLVDGEINDEDYNYILNPYNTTIEKYKRFGAKLRNANILSPVRDLYLGEFGKRFKNIQVLEVNKGDEAVYKKGLNIKVKNWYTQKAWNELNALGLITGHESQDLPPLKNVMEEYDREFNENRIITGQETLDFIKYDKELDDMYQDVYEDWIVAGRAFTYKGISFNDIDAEWVPAEELAFPKKMTSNFIEDGPWAVRRRIAPVHEILDKFHDVLEPHTIDYLNKVLSNNNVGTGGGFVVMPTQYMGTEAPTARSTSRINVAEGLEYFHVQWKGWQKVGELTYMDKLGQIQKIDVDDTYKLNKENGDMSIEWSWISVVIEGYRLAEEGHYWNVRELPYNRMALNNKSLQKLSFNGRVMRTVSGEVKSIIKTGETYQALYNVVSYQREKIINKNKDKVMIMPQSLIPKGRGGWDEEKHMYYADANSYMVVDDSSSGSQMALSAIKVVDRGLGTYINDMGKLLNEIKLDWWDSIGMNRQRYGDTNSSDGKGVNEQAIFRSAIISEELNRKFEKLQEKDYAGYLDLSKLAYIDGKKGQYINSEQREAFLEIAPDDALRRMESEFGVFVRNSSEETEKLQALKDYAFAFAQNGGKAGMFMEMIDTTNFTKGKHFITKMEEIEQQRIDAMERDKNETLKAIEDDKRQSEQLNREQEKYKVDTEYNKAIDVELLRQENQPVETNNENKDLVKDAETIKMNNHKIKIDNENLNLDKQDQKRKEKETNAKVRAAATKVNSN